MAKKKNEERKPDLNEADNQAEIEARIKEMMELDDQPTAAKKPISVNMIADDGLASAPELPGDKKPVSIKIIDHNETEQPVEPSESDDAAVSEEPETDPDVLAAIEEANNQLLNKDPLKESGEEPEALVQENPADIDEEAEPALTAPIIEEQHDEPDEESMVSEDKTLEELWDESAETDSEPASNIAQNESKTSDRSVEQKQSQKDKPLKHLDSIVPKTKVTETIESNSTDKAVDDIIAKEADELLKAEDEKLAAFQPKPEVKPTKKRKGIYKYKAIRRAVILLLLIGIGTAAAVPSSRYYLLNTAGVRSQASITVLDESTQQPLKDVTVTIGGVIEKTNQQGKAQFKKVKLGPTEISIEKRAFAKVTRQHTFGWGSNPLADASLTPTGSQYEFIVTDFLSGKPIAKVEASSNDAAAISNEKGEIKLTIDQQDDSPRDVTINGESYRVERFPLNLDQKEPLAIKLVPARKHVFISNRAGRFDVYKVDVDGKNEKLILPGTGSEREDMVLVHHPTDEVAAVVSTKDNKRNQDGFLLSTLTVLNLGEETTKSVVTSERVQIIDWVGSRIVYVQIKEGASGDSPDRHKLMSFDYKSNDTKELATSNYFNDVLVANGQIFVAPSSTYSQGASSSFVRINADGSNKQTIIAKEVWNIFRTSYERLVFAVGQDWYELKLGESQPGKISGEPPSQTSRIYIDSPDRKRSLWVDTRDGKGVLLAYDSESKQDETIRTQGGLKLPVRWLTNDVLIYRVNTESETADYALNLNGGEPVKVRDVTNTSGVNTWYYY